MAHRKVGRDSIRCKKFCQCAVGGQHGWLSDRGLPQVIFGLGYGIAIRTVDEDELAERFPQQRSHYAIGFSKNLSYDRLLFTEWLQHVHVLRTLSWIQERDFGR